MRPRNTIRAQFVWLVVVQMVLVAGTIWMGSREDFRVAEADARHDAARMARYAADFVVEEREAGHGVADDLKLTIFEPFKQGTVPQHSPGTGVGLTLVSQFAKLHGGRAWVEDRRGGGAVFRVELPATRTPTGRVTQAA